MESALLCFNATRLQPSNPLVDSLCVSLMDIDSPESAKPMVADLLTNSFSPSRSLMEIDSLWPAPIYCLAPYRDRRVIGDHDAFALQDDRSVPCTSCT